MFYLFVLLSAALPYNYVNTQSEESIENANNNPNERRGGYIYYKDGCFYHVVTHSILWGLIQWEENPVLMGCGEGGLWGEGHP